MQYLVKRKGCDYTDYGIVDAQAAKRQRLAAPADGGADTAQTCPVSLAQVDDYEVRSCSICGIWQKRCSAGISVGCTCTAAGLPSRVFASSHELAEADCCVQAYLNAFKRARFEREDKHGNLDLGTQ
jgi:hypothetical protein